METLLYFGKVNIYWILFYACYWLLFRKHTFFLWNRVYLIGSLLISFLLPIISKYQGRYPADNQNNNNRYFNYKMPQVPALAQQDKLFTKAFDFSDDKKPEVKIYGMQLRTAKPAQNQN